MSVVESAVDTAREEFHEWRDVEPEVWTGRMFDVLAIVVFLSGPYLLHGAESDVAVIASAAAWLAVVVGCLTASNTFRRQALDRRVARLEAELDAEERDQP